MFEWLRRFVRPSVGDRVRVTEGPYAGKTGLVIAVADDERLQVYIDDCCQPMLAEREVHRRGGARRDLATAMNQAKLADADGELARAGSHTRDIWNGLAGPR